MIEDTLEHVEDEHIDEVYERFKEDYSEDIVKGICDALRKRDHAGILRVILKYFGKAVDVVLEGHDPAGHDHSCMPRTGEEY